MDLIQILTTNKRKKRTKKVRGIKTPKSPEVKYRRQLQTLVKNLHENVVSSVIPVLKQFESEYVNDAYAISLEQVFDNLRKAYAGIGTEAKFLASSFVENADNTNKRRFYAAMNEAVGVDLQNVVQNEGLDDVLISATNENVKLITTISTDYFNKIETMIYNGIIQGNSADSLIKQIEKISKDTKARPKLIARDQSSKLNAALSRQRQQNLGVEEYVWRTAGDGDRVRPTHRANNGKTFRWDSPPKKTGHPGQDIQCRCVAQPIINI